MSTQVKTGNSSVSRNRISKDGGWGWMVCFACFVVHVILGGLMYSFGVIFVEIMDHYKSSKADTAWIFSILQGVANFGGPVNAVLINRFGCRLVSVWGSVILLVGYVISIWARSVTFLYFSLGILGGIGNGFVYLSSLVCLSQHFDQKRSIATGIAVSGVGIGTFAFGPLTNYLIYTFTWKGAILIQAGITFHCLACSFVYPASDSSISCRANMCRDHSDKVKQTRDLEFSHQLLKQCGDESKNNGAMHSGSFVEQVTHVTLSYGKNDDCKTIVSQNNGTENEENYNRMMSEFGIADKDTLGKDMDASKPLTAQLDINNGINRTKTPSQRQKLYTLRKMLNLLKSVPFVIILISILLNYLGHAVPFMYIVDTAREAGIESDSSSWFISAIGIGNTFGRFGYGVLGNFSKINKGYLYSTSLLLAGIIAALVPIVTSFTVLICFCTLYGFILGGVLTLCLVLLVDIVGTERSSDALGLYCLACGIALFLGPPTAGWLYDVTGSYLATYLFSAATLGIGGLLTFLVSCCRISTTSQELIVENPN